MNKKIISLSAIALSTILTTGCSTTSNKKTNSEPTETGTVVTNDYPTRDRVEYVFNCIAKHGGRLDYVTQYACGCKIDKIAEKLSFAEYEAASTFTMLRSTPGENGAVFRDPKQSKDLRTRLKEAEAYAERSCFIK
ncbi:hypothetical protein BJAS_P3840 [Bathymodiolus japonicus methanotrophic gill symbiont]|uniref:hypothetical protein n=1 Tax=Bathymodiolus japonicus methanotrophic gill symbiont TaxID=113269 RepID=UPI001B67039B|nr:hypothetical protein [Bathymodiolus japonicus methanotrophic gill symbiont]GFO73179.1 hypothetical protein BJAS_P3840 [Bathymodiolus japonicus methanotrophic gill symbiont]